MLKKTPIASNGYNRSAFGMNDKNLTEEASLEAQQLLVESSLPLIFETYDEAVKQGDADPVVLLVDCEDELGSQFACGWLDEETVNDAIAFQQAEEEDGDPESQTTVFARAIAWKLCRAELAEAFPYLAEVFADVPPTDGVLVIGVTAGGASALTAPFTAR